jgi:alkaline phosphatase D
VFVWVALLVVAQGCGCLSSAVADVERPDVLLERLAFGSCNKAVWSAPPCDETPAGTGRPCHERLWGSVRAKTPQMWLWAGDAVYVGHDQPIDLPSAFRAQHAQAGYQQLLAENVMIDGVYDDHDYGGNDEGGAFDAKDLSQAEYLNFIGAGPESPRRVRRGVYTSYLFGDKARHKHTTRLILLDTRYHRDPHIIPSIANVRLPYMGKVPFASLVAAAIRGLTISLGIGSQYQGDVLGDAQWQWLEEQLVNSTASVHIIVSSVQILTTNPLVESWGHFPKSQVLCSVGSRHVCVCVFVCVCLGGGGGGFG